MDHAGRVHDAAGAWIEEWPDATGWDGTGMAIIAAAFGLLIYRSTARSDSGPRDAHLAPVLYLWGVGSALAYSLAYVGRKNGLAEIDAPVFGTMISAVSGFVFFVIAGLLYWFGPPIRAFIEKRLGLVATVFTILLFGGFAAIRLFV